ncbi:helix-turn-helix domain-containing protein [Clostridiaceae bacterium M8S5]|nr:helix-turn-helix domain-containing protein [Clostridiaceae bacterium M8S5]
MELVIKNNKRIKPVVHTIKKHPYHWHKSIAIVKVLRGRIKVRVWASDNLMKKGDFIIFNIGEVYQIEGLSNDNLVLTIYINETYCNNIIEDFKQSIIMCNSIKFEKSHPKKYQKLREYINVLTQALLRDVDFIEIDKCASEFLKYLVYQFDYLACGINLKRFSDKVVARNKKLYELAFLKRNMFFKGGLKDLAVYSGLSYNHLKKDIIERFGYGYRWLKYSFMVEEAAKMILTTEQSLTNIVYTCGFSDPKYMISYFKIFFECTPSQFKKRYKDRYHELLQINEKSFQIVGKIE